MNRERVEKADRGIAACVILLGVLAAVPFARSIAARAPVNFGDLGQYYYWAHYLIEGLRSGHLPEWNPYAFCGYPFVANPQVEAFYPLTALLAVAPLRISFTLQEIAHFWISGILMFAYLRAMKLSKGPALLGAVCWMLGGHLIAAVFAQNTTRIAVLAWIPGIMWATHKLTTGPSVKWVIVWVVFLSVDILGGWPQATAYAMIIALAQVLLSLELSGRLNLGGMARGYALIAACLILTFGVVAVLALPALEFLKLSVRQAPSLAFTAAGSLAPYQLATVLIPNIYGSPAYSNSVFGCMFWEACVYIGVVPLMLLVIPAYDGRLAAIKRFALILCLLFLLLALGTHTPLWALIYNHVPFAKPFRMPLRALAMVQLLLACAAAVGAESLIGLWKENSTRLKWPTRICSIAVLGIGLAVAVSFALGGKLAVLGEKFIRSRYSGAEIVEKLEKLPGLLQLQRESLLIALALSLIGLVLIAGWKRLGQDPARRMAILVLIAAFDLLVFAFPLMRPGNFAAMTATPAYLSRLASEKSEYRILPLHEESFQRNSGAVNGFQSAHGYDALVLKNYATFIASINREKIEDFVPNTADIKDAESRLVNLLNIKYVISTMPMPGTRHKLLFTSGHRCVYENPDVMPRAWLVPEARFVPTESDALKAIGEPSFDPRREVVIVGTGRSAEVGTAQPLGKADFLLRNSDELTVRINATQPAYLVLSEIYCPGWEAWIDGVRTPILRANYCLRAVRVPAGRHAVDMCFSPPALRTGAIVSVATLGILVLLALLSCLIRLRRPLR